MRLAPTLAFLAFASPAFAESHTSLPDGWLTMPEEEFAKAFADMAFSDDLKDRETVAWLYFARMNQQVDAPGRRIDMDTGTVPAWLTWPTDPDTFHADAPKLTASNAAPRMALALVTPKDQLAHAKLPEGVPNAGNEEVTRNWEAYDYLTDGLNSYEKIFDRIANGYIVDMPIGSLETKIKWVPVDAANPAPEGAMVIRFKMDGEDKDFWWAGIHIMAKMRPLASDLYHNEEPSWFWSTFQFTNGEGVAHVREAFITQRAPLSEAEVETILSEAGITGIGLEQYSPNGTQIRFTKDADGTTAVILGHTMMEDFAGEPDPDKPEGWTVFNSSCHTCHATAAMNPKTGEYFPFTVPIGTLGSDYSTQATNSETCETYTADLKDFVPLDFMWPIPFQAPKPTDCKSQ